MECHGSLYKMLWRNLRKSHYVFSFVCCTCYCIT